MAADRQAGIPMINFNMLAALLDAHPHAQPLEEPAQQQLLVSDQVDCYIRKARAERSKAFAELFKRR